MWPDARQRVVRVLGASRLRQIDVPAHECTRGWNRHRLPCCPAAAPRADRASARPAVAGAWLPAHPLVDASVPTPKDEQLPSITPFDVPFGWIRSR
jgi:hypothetical protein